MLATLVIFKTVYNPQSKLFGGILMPVCGGKCDRYFNLYFAEEDTETPVG